MELYLYNEEFINIKQSFVDCPQNQFYSKKRESIDKFKYKKD